MPIYKAVSISSSKIKARWEETYTSAAINIANSTMPRGVYRGFVAAATSPISKSFRLAQDITIPSLGNYDQVMVFRDRMNGYGVVVREGDDVTFDMSGRFSDGGAIPAGGEVWIVYAEITYSTGSTSGLYYVASYGFAVPDNGIVLAKITMPEGATSIQNSHIDTSVMMTPYVTESVDGGYPYPCDKGTGLMSAAQGYRLPSYNQKKGLNAAPTSITAANPVVTKADVLDKYFGEPTVESFSLGVAASKIQLSGSYYISNSSGTAYPSLYFDVRQSGSAFVVPMYSPTYGLRVYVGGVKDSSDTTSLNPSVHADSQGFYSNPWLYFVDEDGTPISIQTFSIVSYKKKQYSGILQAPAQLIPLTNPPSKTTHSSDVFDRAHVDSPDSLTARSLSSQIDQILSLINDRIETNYPESSPSTNDWDLIWRSHNGVGSSVETNIYWQYNRLIILNGCRGGTTANEVIVRTSATMVSAAIFENDEWKFYTNRSTTGGSALHFTDSADWTEYTTLGSDATLFGQNICFTGDTTNRPGRIIGGPTSDFADNWGRLFEAVDDAYGAGTLAYNVYYRSGSIYFVVNAEYNTSDDLWHECDGSRDSWALKVNENGIHLCMHYTTDGSTWNDTMNTSSGWTAAIKFYGGVDGAVAYPVIEGHAWDRKIFYLWQQNQSGSAAYLTPKTCVNWSGYIVQADRSSDISVTLLEKTSEFDADGDITFPVISGYNYNTGCFINSATTSTVADHDEAYYMGYVVIESDY